MKKSHLRNILVPVDFSKLSQLAIETARNLAQRFDATVHLAHVSEFYYPAGFIMPVPMAMMTYYENAAARRTRSLKALAKKNGMAGENCHLVSGTPPFQEICDLARILPADLIVMPTHGRTGLTHFFEGSTAERVVQHAPCPVLVARQREKRPRRAANGKAHGRIDTILLPVDFSESSFQALAYAIEFAERRAAKLLVLHVMHLGHTFDAGGYGAYNLEGLMKAARKDAELQMEELVRLTKFRRVEYETAIRSGAPVTEICKFAGQRDVDLIVTATHGRTGLKHMLIGSVAERVVRTARQSVLVVPSRPEVRMASLLREARGEPPATDRPAKERAPSLLPSTRLTKRDRKLVAHAFPERRQTNKFRESHLN